MNTEDKNINNAAGGRRTYLSPRTEITKMDYYCPLNFWVRYKFRADTSHEVSALFVIFAFVPKLR